MKGLDEWPIYAFSTQVTRHDECCEILHCKVEAKCCNDDGSETPSGYLEACIFYIEGLPLSDYDYLLLDGVSADIEAQAAMMQRQVERLEEVAASSHYFRLSRFISITKLKVNPEARGVGLGLRLMREVVAVFGDSDTMIFIQAHPTEVENPTKAAIKKLANYYKSDSYLGFKDVDSKNELGWLVTSGGGDFMDHGPGSESALFCPSPTES